MSVTELRSVKPESEDFRWGRDLDVDLLRTLVAIADTGSFGRAAQAVFRTPSAVSMQMKKLEDQVGRPLFTKDGRSMALTPDGEILVGYGRRILMLTQEAMQRFLAPDIAGTIRLGTPDDYAGRFLPDILAHFAATHPHVEVDVSCISSQELNIKLDEGEIDVGLVSAGHGPAGGKMVHRERLVWAGLRHGCVHEMRPVPLALSHLGCCWRTMALDSLDRAGVPYRIAYSSRHYLGQLAPLMAGLALAPLPRSTLSGDVKEFGDEVGLPAIGYFGIELRRSPTARGPLYDALADHIESNFRGYETQSAA